jgi:hypothetical protein
VLRAVTTRNLVVHAFDVEVHAWDLLIGQMITALGIDCMAALIDDRTLDGMQCASGSRPVPIGNSQIRKSKKPRYLTDTAMVSAGRKRPLAVEAKESLAKYLDQSVAACSPLTANDQMKVLHRRGSGGPKVSPLCHMADNSQASWRWVAKK